MGCNGERKTSHGIIERCITWCITASTKLLENYIFTLNEIITAEKVMEVFQLLGADITIEIEHIEIDTHLWMKHWSIV